jgi:hypothetical protein
MILMQHVDNFELRSVKRRRGDRGGDVLFVR